MTYSKRANEQMCLCAHSKSCHFRPFAKQDTCGLCRCVKFEPEEGVVI